MIGRAVRSVWHFYSKINGQLSLFIRLGPKNYSAYRMRAAVPPQHVRIFPNGVITDLPIPVAENWHLLHPHPTVLVLLGDSNAARSSWMQQVQTTIHCHFLISSVGDTPDLESKFYTVCDFISDAESTDLLLVKDWIHRFWRRCDIVFLNGDDPLLSAVDLVRLQHAAYNYDELDEVGIVAPAVRVGGRLYAGIDYDRVESSWVASGPTERDYGQATIPRYTLTAAVHGLYVKSSAIDRVVVSNRELTGRALPEQLSLLCAHAWKQNVRTLTFTPLVVESERLRVPVITDFEADWLSKRRVTTEDGRTRLIYVLNATSISGGIRTIFEQSKGLEERGFDVEIWSLEGQPSWFPLATRVKQFRSYSDLLIALRLEEAIKIATWWETGQIVWLASVQAGIPVNLVQEFETWFYPDQPDSRSAVVASYRKEFLYTTIAEYQQGELREVGVEARYIPAGYDDSLFRPITDVARSPDTVLAVGRSFFQKNLKMTIEAWTALGDSRPNLLLYGSEPDVLTDERLVYEVRPSNERVNELYNSATIFIQTSRHEGFSLPILEAMAAGCAVITTDSHGNRGFCDDGVNCLMVELDDVGALSAAITRLLNDEPLRARLAAAGLETAKLYTWDVVTSDLADFYNEVR